MQLRKLLQTEERGVSPVIGVILMVAITVILAAVIASFVLGLGGEQEVAPQSQFDFNYDNSTDTLRISHESGQSVRADRLFIAGQGYSSGPGPNSITTDDYWAADNASGSSGGEPAVRSGDYIVLNTDGASFNVQVVWEAESGDTTSELASHEGPGF